jgi:hypothetical protein
MEPLLTPRDFEEAARANHVSMAQICRSAGVDQSTFQRWKAGADIRMGTYADLLKALEQIISFTPQESKDGEISTEESSGSDLPGEAARAPSGIEKPSAQDTPSGPDESIH